MIAKPETTNDADDAPVDRAAFTLRLNRLMSEAIGGVKICRVKSCRRARRCVSPRFECLAAWQATRPKLSEDESARSIAEFHGQVQTRLRELGG